MIFKEMNILTTLIVLISMFGIYLISGQPLYLFLVFAGLSYVMIQIFHANDYDNKFFYASFSSILVIQLIILIYTYIFRTIYSQYPFFYPFFIFASALLIYNIICLIYYPKDIKIPIK